MGLLPSWTHKANSEFMLEGRGGFTKVKIIKNKEGVRIEKNATVVCLDKDNYCFPKGSRIGLEKILGIYSRESEKERAEQAREVKEAKKAATKAALMEVPAGDRQNWLKLRAAFKEAKNV